MVPDLKGAEVSEEPDNVDEMADAYHVHLPITGFLLQRKNLIFP